MIDCLSLFSSYLDTTSLHELIYAGAWYRPGVPPRRVLAWLWTHLLMRVVLQPLEVQLHLHVNWIRFCHNWINEIWNPSQSKQYQIQVLTNPNLGWTQIYQTCIVISKPSPTTFITWPQHLRERHAKWTKPKDSNKNIKIPTGQAYTSTEMSSPLFRMSLGICW